MNLLSSFSSSSSSPCPVIRARDRSLVRFFCDLRNFLNLLVAASSTVLVLTLFSQSATALTRDDAFDSPYTPTSFSLVSPPQGSVPLMFGGTSEWYRTPAPNGTSVELGVYRPSSSIGVNKISNVKPSQHAGISTILILHGGNGLRDDHERLAKLFSERGYIAVVGCWFDLPSQDADRAVSCKGGPSFKGVNSDSVNDVDALLTALPKITGILPGKIAILGHSYGAAVALRRSAAGHTEPIIAVTGLLAPPDPNSTVAQTRLVTDELPSTVASLINSPLLIVNGARDNITPLYMLDTFLEALSLAGKSTPTVVIEPDAGHNLPAVEPTQSRLVDTVNNWLLSLPVVSLSDSNNAQKARLKFLRW